MKILKNVVMVSISFTLSLPFVYAQTDLDTEDKKFSYAVGNRIGSQLADQFGGQPDIDIGILLEALNARVKGDASLMTEEDIVGTLESKQQAQLAEAEAAALAKTAEGQAFLEENAQREGVTVTESGLIYEIKESGDEAGDTPTLQDTVVVHYQGTLIDGTVFDSSITRGAPATFSLQSIIPGWTEVLQLMRAGDKWSIILPPELAYGERGAGQLIGPNEVLLFDIELLEIKKSAN